MRRWLSGNGPGEPNFELVPDHGLCRLCGSTAGQRICWPEVYLGGGQSLRRCAHCGGVYLGPDFTASSLERFYTRHYRRFFPGEVPWRNEARFFAWRGDREIARLRLAHIAPFLANGAAVFEMGSGFGAFLGAAHWARPDLRLSAREPDEINRLRLLDGAQVNFTSAPSALPASSLDAVVAFHALEHLTNPRGFLEGLGRALKPGGRAWIEVPDLMCGWRSRNFVHPAHLSYFTADTLMRLVTAAGLQVDYCGRHPIGGVLTENLWAAISRPADTCVPRPIQAAPVCEIHAIDMRIDSVTWRWRDRLRRFGKHAALRLLGCGPVGEYQRWRNYRTPRLGDRDEIR